MTGSRSISRNGGDCLDYPVGFTPMRTMAKSGVCFVYIIGRRERESILHIGGGSQRLRVTDADGVFLLVLA